MKVKYDELDGFWYIEDDEGNEVAAPFESEQDAYDYIEAWLDH